MTTIRLMTERDDIPVSRIVSECYRLISEFRFMKPWGCASQAAAE